MAKTAIEWTDLTWNPVTGCTKVSPGCAHCYAERVTLRFKRGPRYLPGESEIVLHPDRLAKPLGWRAPRRVFVCSMSDLFHEDVPDEFIRRVLFTCRSTAQHTYQVLTKRHERLAALADGLDWPPNVWVGVSVENQRWADARIPALLTVPVSVRFISAEPLLKPVVLAPYLDRLQWVIVGGESGPKARPMDAAWARSIRDECAQAGVAFFFKQWGGLTPKSRGRQLDGRTYDQFPERRNGHDRITP